MGHELVSTPGLDNEMIFEAAGTSPVPFKLGKMFIPHSDRSCYVVTLTALLDDAHLERVVALARKATVAIGNIDDLDFTPNTDHFPVDLTNFRFTHALEHLTVIHLARISLSALIQFKFHGIPGGKTTIYREASENERKFHIGFSLTPGLSPSPEYEQMSIKNACTEISQVK